MDYIAHFGIKRRSGRYPWGSGKHPYQNEDGTLTEEGRRRLGLDEHGTKYSGNDYVIKKGAKLNRVLKSDYYEDDPIFSKDVMDKKLFDDEKKYTQKYVTPDDTIDSSKQRGDDFYVGWFSDGGYELGKVYVDQYLAKNEIKVANGKKVVEELLKDIGDVKVSELFKNQSLRSATIDMVYNREQMNRIVNKMKSMGYDAMEDINDNDSDSPLIIFDSNKSMSLNKRMTGEEWYNDIYKKRHNIN